MLKSDLTTAAPSGSGRRKSQSLAVIRKKEKTNEPKNRGILSIKRFNRTN